MKRLFAILLTALMIISVVPFSALAEETPDNTPTVSQPEETQNNAEEQSQIADEPEAQDDEVTLELPAEGSVITLAVGKETCTEEEFKEILNDSSKAATNTKTVYSPGISSKGFHYTYLTSIFQREVYEACENKLPKSSFTKSEYNVTVTTDELNGYVYNSSKYNEAYKNIVNELWKGSWCFRYDNIKRADPYTSSVSAYPSVNYSRSTGKVTSISFKLEFKVHSYYNSYLDTVRDYRIEQIASKAATKTTTYEKLKAIYEEIIKTSYYDYRTSALNNYYSGTETFFYAHSSYGILNRGVGVCESYAKSFKLVCDYLELAPCILLISETHMWNAVYLDGKWYGLDATWDDPGNNSSVWYTYFLCGDPDDVDGSSNDHVIDYTTIVGPEYADDSYSPYVPACTHSFDKIVPTAPAKFGTDGSTEGIYCSQDDCSYCLKTPTLIPAIETVSVSKTTYAFTGEAIKATVVAKDRTGKTISSKYYSLSYSSGCTNPGTYKVTVKFKGNYSGTVTKSFKIAVSKPTVKFYSTTSAVKIYWSRVSGMTGYAVYSSSKKLITRKNISSYKFSRLTAGKSYTYYVRAYKTVRKKTYYSDYVKVSTATCPKAPSVKASSSTSRINYSWSKVYGASGYMAYNSSKKLIKDKITTIKAYADDLSAGRYYTYYFRAYKTVGSKRVYSSLVKVTYATKPKFSSSSVTTTLNNPTKLSLTTTAKKISWSSSNKSVATVSSRGYVTGKKYGTATITAVANGQKATVKVVVTKASIKLSKSSYTLKAHFKYKLTAKTTPSTAKVYWKSSNTSVATVTSSGTVNGIKPGTATITAYFKIGSKTYTATCRITVTIPCYPSSYGFGSSVPDFGAMVGNGKGWDDYEWDYGSDGTEYLYLYYYYSNANWDGCLENATIPFYADWLKLKGFSYVGYSNGYSFYEKNGLNVAMYHPNASSGVAIVLWYD